MSDAGAIRVGCAEYGFRLLGIRERVDMLARLGFREVEFGIGGDFPGRLAESPGGAAIADFRRLHEQRGLVPRQAVVESDFTVADPAEARRGVDRFRRLLRVAAECGATTVCTAPAPTPIEAMDERRRHSLVDALTRCDETAREEGVTIGLETLGQVEEVKGRILHRHGVMTLAEPLDRLLGELPDRIGVVWDIGNVKAAEGGEPALSDYLHSVVDGRIVSAHLKDWAWGEEEGWRPVALGDDDVDYSSLVPVLGSVPVALVEYENPGDVEEGTRRSLERLLALGAVLA